MVLLFDTGVQQIARHVASLRWSADMNGKLEIISTSKDGEESGSKFYLLFTGNPSKLGDLVPKRKQLNANVPMTLDSMTKMTELFMVSHSQRVDYLLN